MGEVPPLTELYQKYRARGFEFFIVYTREAHPGENFPHHVSLEQKVSHAKELKELDEVKINVLVDDFEGSTHNAYGALPNMIYLSIVTVSSFTSPIGQTPTSLMVCAKVSSD